MSKQFVCQYCDFTSKDEMEFSRHISDNKGLGAHPDEHSPKTCFCGNNVTTYTHRRGYDDYGWESTCDYCGYLWDED